MQVIPFGQLMMSLFSLVLPITLGMWIRYRFTKGAKFMKAVIVPFTLITVLFIFTVRFHHICRLQISKSNMKLFITGGVDLDQAVRGAGAAASRRLRIQVITLSSLLFLHLMKI